MRALKPRLPGVCRGTQRYVGREPCTQIQGSGGGPAARQQALGARGLACSSEPVLQRTEAQRWAGAWPFSLVQISRHPSKGSPVHIGQPHLDPAGAEGGRAQEHRAVAALAVAQLHRDVAGAGQLLVRQLGGGCREGRLERVPRARLQHRALWGAPDPHVDLGAGQLRGRKGNHHACARSRACEPSRACSLRPESSSACRDAAGAVHLCCALVQDAAALRCWQCPRTRRSGSTGACNAEVCASPGTQATRGARLCGGTGRAPPARAR